MQYPNRLQAALLLDARFDGLDALVRDFARIAQMKSGAVFTITEHRPGSFLRLAGGGAELMLTFEQVPVPPVADTLAAALASPATAQLCPDMAGRVAQASSHLLLEASHGVFAGLDDDPRFASLFDQLASDAPDHLPAAQSAAFESRLDTLALMARVASDHACPVAIHWTQSDRLLDPETFEAMAVAGFPGPLAIHPLLFGHEPAGVDPARVGLRTLGARHWLGREVLVPATTLPWPAAYQTVLDFIALASGEAGYVIPDGDTFGPEDGSELWRVHHRDASPDTPDAALPDAPPGEAQALYVLEPLRHDASGFPAAAQAPDPAPLEPPVRPAPAPPSAAPSAPPSAPGPSPDFDPPHSDREERSSLAELQAALAEGRALAAANPPEKLPFSLVITTQSRPGSVSVSGRSLRARVFGPREGTDHAAGPVQTTTPPPAEG